MEKAQQKLFAATFFNDIAALKEILEKSSETILSIPIPETYRGFSQSDNIAICAEHIALMTCDCFYDYRDQSNPIDAKVDESFSGLIEARGRQIIPQDIYNNAVEVLKLFNNYVKVDDEIDYKNLLRFTSVFNLDDETDRWFAKEDIDGFIQSGFRRIDVELMNCTDVKDRKKIVELLELGANPYVDLDEAQEGSNIMNIMGMDLESHMNIYCGLWNLNKDEINDDKLIFDMLLELSITAGNADMIRTINKHTKFNIKG